MDRGGLKKVSNRDFSRLYFRSLIKNLMFSTCPISRVAGVCIRNTVRYYPPDIQICVPAVTNGAKVGLPQLGWSILSQGTHYSPPQ